MSGGRFGRVVGSDFHQEFFCCCPSSMGRLGLYSYRPSRSGPPIVSHRVCLTQRLNVGGVKTVSRFNGRRCRLIQDFIPVVPARHHCPGPPPNHPHGSDLDSPWRSAAPLGSALPVSIAAPSGWFAPRGDRWADW